MAYMGEDFHPPGDIKSQNINVGVEGKAEEELIT